MPYPEPPPDLFQAPPQPPSLLGRFGRNAANIPSNLANDVLRLLYNAGFHEEGDQPVEVPKPFDVAPPTTRGESIVDVGSNIAESIPLFMAGATAGEGAAKLLGSGPRMAAVLRGAAEFGLPAAARSPEEGVTDAALGGTIGLASKLPLPMRLLAGLGIGATTGVIAHEEGRSTPASIAIGATNALMPLMGGRAAKVVEDSAGGDVNFVMGDGVAPRWAGQGPTSPITGRPALPFGERIPPEVDNPVYPQQPRTMRSFAPNSGRMLEGGQNGPESFIEGEFEKIVPQAPEGSLTNRPIFPLRDRQQPTPLPPPGSLLAEARYTEHEANVIARTQGPPQVIAGRTSRPPIGSLIREPRFTEQESLDAAQVKAGLLTPATAKNLLRPPESQRISTEGLGRPIEPEPAPPPPPVATLQSQAPSKSGKLRLNDVITPENYKKAAEQLGLENAGNFEGTPFITARDPLHNGNIGVKFGQTFRDLKNEQYWKRREFAAKDLEELDAVKAEREALKGKPPKAQAPRAPITSDAAPKEEQKLTDVLALLEPKQDKEVATLQSEKAVAESATSPPSSPEIALPQGLKVGDKAQLMFEGERLVGEIVSAGDVEGTIKLRTKEYGELDRPFEEIKQLGVRTTDESPIKSVGGLTELENLGTEAQGGFKKVGGGKMRQSNFGEAGFIEEAALRALTKYAVAPAVGGLVGYATDQDPRPEHRLGSAIMFAVASGIAAHYGMEAIAAMSKAYPEMKGAGTFVGKVAETAKAAAKEASKLGSMEEAATKADTKWNFSTAIEKTALWLRQNATTRLDITRMQGRAIGEVKTMADMLDKSLREIERRATKQDRYAIGQFFRGQIRPASLPFVLQTKDLMDAVNGATTARSALQNIIVEGLGGKGKLADTIRESMDSYLTRTFRIFNDAKYEPTDDQIKRAAEALGDDWGDFDARYRLIHQYIKEVKQNRQIFAGILRPKFTSSKGESLDAILTRREDLSPEFMDMLGMYRDPIHQMAATGVKLVNAARSAEYFNEVARGTKADGLKYAYSTQERASQISRLNTLASTARTQTERDAAVATLQELEGYTKPFSEQRFGRLSDAWIDPRARDQLANYHQNMDMFQTQMGRNLANLTNSIKYGQVVLSPLQLLRQVYQMPLLMLMGRVNPLHLPEAYRILWSKDAAYQAERARLTQLGIIGGDLVAGELRRDMRAMMEGRVGKLFDRTTLGDIKSKWEEMFRTPDVMTRIASYLGKEKELLQQYGKSPEARNMIENMAIDHTNRYTMNYAAVPPIVIKGRQLPFINQYLTFTYEMTRITKNLTQDAMKGDMYAIGALSTLIATPFVLQKTSESTLSDKDQKDWNNLKRLGPAYSRYNFKFVTGRQPDGQFRYVDFTPLIPHDSWLKTIRAIMSGDRDSVMQVNPILNWENTPVLNVLSDFDTGRDRLSGDPIDRFSWDMVNQVRREVFPTLLGTEFDRIVRALTPNAQGGFGVTNLRTGQQNSIEDILFTHLTSMRPYTVNPKYQAHLAMAETTQLIDVERRKMQKIMNSNAAPAIKLNARKQFEYSTKQLVATLQQRLGVAANPEEILRNQ